MSIEIFVVDWGKQNLVGKNIYRLKKIFWLVGKKFGGWKTFLSVGEKISVGKKLLVGKK